jgi:hypothetical protein
MRTIPIAVAIALAASGCAELVTTGSTDIAGVVGGAAAGAISSNPAVAAAAALGAQAGARTGMQYAQRQVHRAAQDQIAQAAGELKIGQVAPWNTRDRLVERGQQGRVTVSRLISATGLQCKEIIFSVDTAVEGTPQSAFYMSAICRDGARWKWASAEPATERWGALQ